MRLTVLLLAGRRAPGNINTGKNRIYPKVTHFDVVKARRDIERTERNILLLRHPYLTIKQSHGHEEALHDEKLEEFKSWVKRDMEKKARKRPDQTMENRFKGMSHSESWDGGY